MKSRKHILPLNPSHQQSRYFFVYGLLCIFSVFFFSGISIAETKPPGRGSYFPTHSFSDILPKEEQTYLGITPGKNFSIKNIRSVVIIEMFNTYCTICPKNVPVLNEVYSLIENDPKLKGKIKVISVAVGNTPGEIMSYKKTQGVRYPILSDLRFTLHQALGNPRVPYTMLIKRNKMIYAHHGVIDSPETLLHSAEKLLN